MRFFIPFFIGLSGAEGPRNWLDLMGLSLEQSREAKDRVFFDHILMKFNKDCQANVTLEEHIHKAMAEKGTGKSFMSLDSPTGTSRPKLMDPGKFVKLLHQQLPSLQEIQILGGSVEYVGAKRRQLEAVRRESGATRRRLTDLDELDRENQLLSVLHLLSAVRLVGEENVARLIELERRGDFAGALAHIREKNPHIDEKKMTHVYKKLYQLHEQKHQLLQKAGTQAKAFLGIEELPQPVVQQSERLHHLEGIHVVHNPFLEQEMIEFAQLLPCQSFDPEPDRSKVGFSGDLINILPSGTTKKRSTSTPPHHDFLATEMVAHIEEKYSVATDVRITGSDRKLAVPEQVFIKVDPEGRLASDFKGDSRRSEGWLGRIGEIFKSSASKPEEVYFLPPNDEYLRGQWYMRGPAQGDPFGVGVLDGWSRIILDRNNVTNNDREESKGRKEILYAELEKAQYGMTVGVLDSGCSRNEDLINRFWINPACKEAMKNHKGKVDEKDLLPGGIPYSIGSEGCIGYDFGNDNPDPTLETYGKLHGSSTSGLIAAETNNVLGISGICPKCDILCLKIFDFEKNEITLSSVIKALDFLSKKNIKISNHSYGGFGYSKIEYSAHQTLAKKGHLAITSSGNNGCDLDRNSLKNSCPSNTPFTPAAYNVPSIMVVGATDREGNLASFSNYGEKSVDIFAPGDGILTLYGTSQLATVKGTSFSAPIATGVSAMLWSLRPELKATEVKSTLMETGIPSENLKTKGVTNKIISLSRALSALEGDHGASREYVSPSGGTLSLAIPLLVILLSGFPSFL